MTTNLLHRHTAVTPPMAVAGDGCYIIDSNGKRYLDACGGAAVSALGHSNEAVLDAARDQLGKLAFAHTGFFTSEPAEQLGAKLVSLAPDGISHVYFVSGGSEAVETAIKLARQFQIEHGKPTKSKIIARWQGYHGNTLGALAAGGNRWRREPFAPLLSDAFQHIDPCYYWRHGNNDETPFAYGQRMANQLETAIVEAGPDNVAAFMAETVVGATLGAVPAVEGYFKRIREICDQYDVLLILDEVMCGMGRTGYLFASEAEGISPDIVCIAKALGAGIQPVGATLCTQDIYDAIAGGTGFFQHGFTYIGHPTACAAGLAVLGEIEKHDLLSNVRKQGDTLHARLLSAFGQHPNVGDIRGRGLFQAIELVADRETKEPLSPNLKTHAKIKAAALADGLMVYPMGGTVDGQRGDHVLLAPPYIIDDTHVDEIVGKLSDVIDRVLQ